jgi:hypothetical protein
MSKKTIKIDASQTSGTSPSHCGRKYFNILQAADYTATTPSWVEKRLRDGSLPYRWAGNRRVITKDRLDELMASLPEEKGLCDRPAFMGTEKKRKAA